MKNAYVILFVFFCIVFKVNAQESDRDLFFNDAKQLLNDGSYENAISQLDYFFTISKVNTDADIEYLYVNSWLGLGNYLEADRHIEKYLAITTDKHEKYTEIKDIQEGLKEELEPIKLIFKEWAKKATKNGEPYNWSTHNDLLPIGVAPAYDWCGYVDKEGKVVIPFKYKVASHFENGIAYVKNKISGDNELIDATGKVAYKLAPEIESVYPFQEGYAGVLLKRVSYQEIDSYGIIDSKGNRIDKKLLTGYDQRYVFSDGSRYPILKEGNFGAVSVATGESIVDEEQYAILSTFHNGKMLVRPKNYLSYQFLPNLPSDFGMIDQKGNEFIPNNTYPELEPFFNKYTIAGKAGKGYGVLNTNLDVVIPFEHALIGRTYSEDEFVIFDQGDLRGKARVYNAKLDKMLSRPVQTTSKRAAFPGITITYPSFTEKYMALVTKKGKVRYYDHDLNDVFEKDFDYAKDFSEGMAAVMNKNGDTGYINESGDIVVDYTYRIGQLFSNGLAAVANGDSGSEKYGFINKKGEVVIPIEYDYAEPFFDATEIFKDYYSIKQLTLLPKGDFNVDPLDIVFDTNEVFFHLLEGKKLALVKKKDKLQFIDQKGKVWLERLWSSLNIVKKP